MPKPPGVAHIGLVNKQEIIPLIENKIIEMGGTSSGGSSGIYDGGRPDTDYTTEPKLDAGGVQ